MLRRRMPRRHQVDRCRAHRGAARPGGQATGAIAKQAMRPSGTLFWALLEIFQAVGPNSTAAPRGGAPPLRPAPNVHEGHAIAPLNGAVPRTRTRGHRGAAASALAGGDLVPPNRSDRQCRKSGCSGPPPRRRSSTTLPQPRVARLGPSAGTRGCPVRARGRGRGHGLRCRVLGSEDEADRASKALEFRVDWRFWLKNRTENRLTRISSHHRAH